MYCNTKVFLQICVFAFILMNPTQILAANADISATVKITICGDGFVDTTEQCDGTNLNNISCISRGFSGGVLSCNQVCEFNVSQCIYNQESSRSYGGGGRSNHDVLDLANVIFKGKAYPGSKVTLLKDAQIAASVNADSAANFNISLSGLSNGSYTFSIYGLDTSGERSALQTFPITITNGVTVNVSSIFIAPTIATDKTEVRRGDNITFFGRSAPASEVIININSYPEFFIKRIADVSGFYLLNFDTSILNMGDHSVKSKASLNDEVTPFGKTLNFSVGTRNVEVGGKLCTNTASEVNGDCRVNIVDFSILAYWYKRNNVPSHLDLNGDKKVDLIDFSIMAYNWTG